MDAAVSNLLNLRAAVTDAWNQARRVAEHESRYDHAAALHGYSLRTLVSTAVEDTLAGLAAQYNATSIFARLPPELVAAVMSWLPVIERARASQTCKTWHHVTFSAPHVWTDISYDSGSSPDAVRAMVRLSRDCPVTLDIELDRDTAHHIAQAVQRCTHRCKELRVTFNIKLLQLATEDVAQPFIHPAPLLRRLWIEDGINCVLGPVLSCRPLFGGHAPRLQSVVFRGEIESLANSTDTLRSVRRVYVHELKPLAPEGIQQIMNLFPAIEQLLLQVDVFLLFDTPVRLPSSLEVFEILTTDDHTGAADVLSAVNYSSILRISMQQQAGITSEAQIVNYFRGTSSEFVTGGRIDERLKPVRCAWVDWPWNASNLADGVNVHIYADDEDMHVILPLTNPDRAKPRRVWERVLTNVATPLPAQVFSSITRLYINELVFDTDSLDYELPPMPSLVTLFIWLIPEAFHRCGLGSSPFTFSETESGGSSSRRLTCPELKTLHIVAGHEEWTLDGLQPRLTAQMVLQFVSRCLQYDTQQLSMLSFIGVELVAIQPDELDHLVQLAAELQFEPRFLSWSANNDCYWLSEEWSDS
ncbi:hypothetical protein BKA62DRAFT_788536 [Auriculariales sp. MPI-PUGE-AT-0066]|nr:hypothetical protein BKA62DRAFT_788536 [Auriculariales sp. MPI-PUGE-AT-0066]